jgi:hypothetical protein
VLASPCGWSCGAATRGAATDSSPVEQIGEEKGGERGGGQIQRGGRGRQMTEMHRGSEDEREHGR